MQIYSSLSHWTYNCMCKKKLNGIWSKDKGTFFVLFLYCSLGSSHVLHKHIHIDLESCPLEQEV